MSPTAHKNTAINVGKILRSIKAQNVAITENPPKFRGLKGVPQSLNLVRPENISNVFEWIQALSSYGNAK